MGWNSWNTFAGNINEQLIKGWRKSSYRADAKGWIYLHRYRRLLEAMARDTMGNLIADPAKFPGG